MTDIINWLAQVSLLGWIGSAIAALVVALIVWRLVDPLGFFDFLYGFPLRLWGPIGKLRELKKDTKNLNDNWKYGMSRNELELCQDYAAQIRELPSKDKFEKYLEYLEATGQSSIRPMAWWMWAILLLLTIGEAVGTGALLSEFISATVTATQAFYYTWGFAIFIAVALLLLTHKAGTTYFERKLCKEILGSLAPDSPPEDYIEKTPDGHEIRPNYSSLDSDQFADKHKSRKARFYARLERDRARGSMVWVILVFTLLAILMIAVFGARMYAISKQTTIEVAQIAKNGIAGVDGESFNPFANIDDNTTDQGELPPSVAQAQTESRQELAEKLGKDTLGQGLMASIILTLFYVLVQILGFFMSAHHSFFQKGKDAYKLTYGCRSYEELMKKYFKRCARYANKRLDNLRRAYAKADDTYGKCRPDTSFEKFYYLSQEETRLLENNKLASEQKRAEDTPATQAVLDQSSFDAMALAKEIDAISDEDQKRAKLKAVYDQCTPEQCKALMAAMQQIKDARSKPDISELEALL